MSSPTDELPLLSGVPTTRSTFRALIALAAVLALFFYPVLAFAIAAFALLNDEGLHSAALRRTLALVAATSISLIAASRVIEGTAVQDIVGYYDVYLNLRAGDTGELLHYGAGLEMATTLLFYLWALLLPKLSINGLMLCLCLTSSWLLVAWVEVTFYRGGDKAKPSPMLIGFAVLLLNLYFATQLSRQFLSAIILLFSLSSTTRWRSIAWLALAASFHLTAIPFYVIFKATKSTRFGVPLLIAAALAFRFSFATVLSNIDIFPGVAADKLLYYVDRSDSDVSADLTSLRFLVLLCGISLVTFIALGRKLQGTERQWAALPWIATLVHLSLLSIPLVPLRTTLAIHSIITGVIAYKISSRLRVFTLILANLLLAYKFAGYVSFYEAHTGMSTFEAIARSFES